MDEATFIRRGSRAILLMSAVVAVAFVGWGLLTWFTWSPRSLDVAKYPPEFRDELRASDEKFMAWERDHTKWRSIGLVTNGVVFGVWGFISARRLRRKYEARQAP